MDNVLRGGGAGGGVQRVTTNASRKTAVTMGFSDAINHGFRHYFDFDGRASRSEFWYFLLFYGAAYIAIVIITATEGFLGFYIPMSILLFLVLGIPATAVGVRRLHDVNCSGWWYLLTFIPIAQVVLLYWYVKKGTSETNRYGPPVG